MLLKLAEPSDLNGALNAAVRVGDLPRHKDAPRTGRTTRPEHPAICGAFPDNDPTRHDPDADRSRREHPCQDLDGGTILEFAKRQGNTTLVDALSRAGVKDEGPVRPLPTPKPSGSVRGALDRSLPPLQRADVAFIQKAGCVSCHNNSLTAMTIAAARATGVRVDEHIARAQLQRTAAYLEENRERALENVGIPGGIDTVSYILLGMAAEKYPSDPITDAWARYVKNNQSPDGRWQCASMRPPLESSDFQVTAASIRSLRTYGPKSQRARVRRRCSACGSLARKGQTDQHGRSRIHDTRVDLGRRKRRGDPEGRSRTAGAAAV